MTPKPLAGLLTPVVASLFTRSTNRCNCEINHGAEGGSRTHTTLRSTDSKSQIGCYGSYAFVFFRASFFVFSLNLKFPLAPESHLFCCFFDPTATHQFPLLSTTHH